MKRWITGVAVLVVLAALRQADAAIQWQIGDGGNGHYYEYVDQSITWPTAKAAAESMTFMGLPGHLATITSAAENDFVYQHVFASRSLNAWIGLTDNEAYGGHESFGLPNFKVDGWVWVTGEPVAFTDWGSFESGERGHVEAPDNFGDEDYTVMGIPDWNDTTDYYTTKFLVEYEAALNGIPEPTTFIIWSLLGGLGIAFGWWRRRKAA